MLLIRNKMTKQRIKKREKNKMTVFENVEKVREKKEKTRNICEELTEIQQRNLVTLGVVCRRGVK